MVIHVDVAGRVRAVVLLRAAERSMIYLLYCAAPCVLHTITADLFSLMMLKMELKLFFGAYRVIFSSRGDSVGNVSCSIFLVGSV